MSRWGLAHQVVGQLLFLRPVPGFTPSADAYAPAVELVGDVRRLLQAATDRAQLHPAAATDEGEALLSILVAGMVTQQLANDPDAAYEQGRFTRLAPQLLHMFARTYSPQE